MTGPAARIVTAVVVALLDGRRVKGFVYGFNASSDEFSLFPKEGLGQAYATHMAMGDCKAIFFVKSHEGNKGYREDKTTHRAGRIRGRRVEVVFNDGEKMAGTTEAYSPARVGFFMYPPDPNSNNLRIFVLNRNVRQVLTEKGENLAAARGEFEERSFRLDPSLRPEEVPASDAPGSIPSPASPAAGGTLGPPQGSSGFGGAINPSDPGLFPPQRKVDAVVRLLKGEDVRYLAEEICVPAGILLFWKQTFLESGLAALSGGGVPKDEEVRALEDRIRDLEAENAELRGLVRSAQSFRGPPPPRR